ncbi:WD40 repeat-like protein, partial [Schizopora paradoxa]
FITGGYDRAIELWTVEKSLCSAVSVSLTIHHHSTIYSLTTLKDTSQKVVSSGADCIVNIWDLASERTIKSLRTSNMVYHVHATERPGCVLYEVAHRDSQFELHDYRAHLGRPSLRFGFITSAVNGRYMKGDIRGNTFVSGDRNGNIRHWDLRNVREPLQNVEVFPGQKIVQTAFDGDALAIVPEDNSLLFLNVKEGE